MNTGVDNMTYLGEMKVYFCIIIFLFFTGQYEYHITVKKVKGSRYRPGVAQRVGRVIAVLFHDCGTRRG